MKRRNAFTLIELLVVISIIALLIALLLPALGRAKQLALQTVGASNMRQIGIALHEYANEFRGQYPLACTSNYNFGNSSLGTGATPGQQYAPLAGLSALYVSSYGYIPNQPIINPRGGFLPPTPAGISLLFSPDTNSGFSQSASFPPASYNAQGLCVAWQVPCGMSYWVDEGRDYSPAYDLSAISFNTPTPWTADMALEYGGGPVGRYNPDPLHVPALNPQSGPGTILVTDTALFTGPFVGTAPAQGAIAGQLPGWGPPPVVYSNYVDNGPGNYLPAGEHEMYNDGSVRWVPLSKIRVRFSWVGSAYQGW